MKPTIKKTVLAMTATFILLPAACSNAKSEYEDAARERATVAAKALIATDHNDIFKMENMILEAKAVQSEYLLMGDTVAAEAFDIAFREYLSANDSLLAKEMF